ncbi:hypothetical protein HNQ93_004417 [Hymenobacter luteus]|uniref:Uncharacterized protein n=2 Tax=Hymenobacter TaxID=89966 RepID=A0A7W9WEJ2_9BACT|nr:hypothetical protein [Hymenobacter latericoloratus]MBB6061536.1 hypothetical protein [Hymenobacter luteus]
MTNEVEVFPYLFNNTPYTDALAKAGFSCVLNDTRSVRGPWDHSMEWVLNEWAPNAAQAGLRHFCLLIAAGG